VTITTGGRGYVVLHLLDADGREVTTKVEDLTNPPSNTRIVVPYICTECYSITTDLTAHNVAHDGPSCRVCGCTAENGCYIEKGPFAESCHWVEPDLCSACAPHLKRVEEALLRASEATS
jgi:hypothetical protein